MMRILARVSIYGTKKTLGKICVGAPILNGVLEPVGLARKVPDLDSWCYASPWYRFHHDKIDEELGDFLTVNVGLEDFVATDGKGIVAGVVSLCPVGEGFEERFACVLTQRTLRLLLRTGLDFEVAPASVMPEVPYWRE